MLPLVRGKGVPYKYSRDVDFYICARPARRTTIMSILLCALIAWNMLTLALLRVIALAVTLDFAALIVFRLDLQSGN
jgi:hypothetical protein